MGCASCAGLTYYGLSPIPWIVAGGRGRDRAPPPSVEPDGDCGCGCSGASTGGACGIGGACGSDRGAGAVSPRALDRLASGYRSARAAALGRSAGFPSRGERSAGLLTVAQAQAMSDERLCEVAANPAAFGYTTVGEQDLIDYEFTFRDFTPGTCTREVVSHPRGSESEAPFGLGGEGDRSGLPSSFDDAADRAFADATPADRERIIRTAANDSEPDAATDAAAAARRDAIIQEGLRGGFQALQSYLERNYRTHIEEIHGATSITLATITADDRERERIHQEAMACIRRGGTMDDYGRCVGGTALPEPGGGSGGGSSDGGGLAVLGLVAAFLGLFK